jgi:hypothetical protein
MLKFIIISYFCAYNPPAEGFGTKPVLTCLEIPPKQLQIDKKCGEIQRNAKSILEIL